MKILVTGVSGFVGGRIAAALAQHHQVWGVYRTTRPKHLESIQGLTLVQDDLCRPVNLPRTCDYVVHAAADTPGNTNDGARHWRSNRDGMQSLLNWSAKAGVSRIMFFSTMDVYGIINLDSVNEKTPSCQPNTYGASKLAAEQLLEEHSRNNSGVRCVTVRLPGVVGKEAQKTFLPRVVQKILTNSPAIVYQKTSLFNNTVYIGNIIKFALTWPVSSEGRGYAMFNAASECPIPLEKVISLLAKTFNRSYAVEENMAGRPPFVINTDLARRSGFPVVPTETSLLAYADEVLLSQPCLGEESHASAALHQCAVEHLVR